MNGVHDLGGMHGFGPIPYEKNEPVFHADWERRMYGIARLVMNGRLFNLDEYRHAIERIPPPRYLGAKYYEKWLMGCVGLLLEKGIIKPSEAKALGPIPVGPPISLAGARARRKAPAPAAHRPVKARFGPGDQIVTRNFQPRGHTRIPRYSRGKRGVIDRDEGVFLLPDLNAHSGPPTPQHVYSVRFAGRELWGESAPAREFVYIDLWEDYLQPFKQRPARRRAGRR